MKKFNAHRYDKKLLKRYKKQFLEYLDIGVIDNLEIYVLAEGTINDFKSGQLNALEEIRKYIRKEIKTL